MRNNADSLSHMCEAWLCGQRLLMLCMLAQLCNMWCGGPVRKTKTLNRRPSDAWDNVVVVRGTHSSSCFGKCAINPRLGAGTKLFCSVRVKFCSPLPAFFDLPSLSRQHETVSSRRWKRRMGWARRSRKEVLLDIYKSRENTFNSKHRVCNRIFAICFLLTLCTGDARGEERWARADEKSTGVTKCRSYFSTVGCAIICTVHSWTA